MTPFEPKLNDRCFSSPLVVGEAAHDVDPLERLKPEESADTSASFLHLVLGIERHERIKISLVEPDSIVGHDETDDIASRARVLYLAVVHVEEVGGSLDDYPNEAPFGRYLRFFQCMDRIDDGFEQRQ